MTPYDPELEKLMKLELTTAVEVQALPGRIMVGVGTVVFHLTAAFAGVLGHELLVKSDEAHRKMEAATPPEASD